MAEYQLTATDVVIHTVDQLWIPSDPANMDRVRYEAWLDDGGVPDPYVAPLPAPPTPQTQVLYDHENRIRTQEGEPPLTLGDFLQKTGLG